MGSDLITEVRKFLETSKSPSYGSLVADVAGCATEHEVVGALADIISDAAVEIPYPASLVQAVCWIIEDGLGESEDREISYYLSQISMMGITASLPWMGPRTLCALETLEDEVMVDAKTKQA